MRKLALMMAGMLVCASLCGQRMSDEYEREYGSEEGFRDIFSDIDLLLLPLGDGSGVFDRLSRFNFNFVTYRHRGLDGRFGTYYLENLDISASYEKYADYAFYSALRIAAPLTSQYPGHEGVLQGAGGIGGNVLYGFRPSRGREGISLKINYSEQRYRAGAAFAYGRNLGRGWTVRVNAYSRAGRDKFVRGVFTENYTVSAGAEKDMGRSGNISLFYMRSASGRGLRSWTVGEAYGLTRDNLYNPAWGPYGGKERNSRVRADADDIVSANYSFASGNTDVSVSAMFRVANRGRSGLAWMNAGNPVPDYYMNLPGYYSDPQKREELTVAWRDDRRVRELNWDRIRSANYGSDTGANYIVDEKVERIRSLQAAVSATTAVSKGFTVGYGLRASAGRSNYFRRVKDLLGAEYIYDYDQYLLGSAGSRDDFYQNDLRNPDRKVGRGGRLGYDYDVPHGRATAFGSATLRQGRWLLDFGADITLSSLYREGHTEKGSFPSGQSYGRSDRFSFTTYAARVSARYSLSALHHLSASVLTGQYEPVYDNIFLNPASHSHYVNNPVSLSVSSLRLSYRGSVSPAVDIDAAVYLTGTSRETEIFRYYDDISSLYMLMPLRGVDKRFAGIEAGIEARITGRLTFLAAGSLNDYRYVSDARADLYSDVDLKEIMTDGVVYLSDYVCSPSPQTLFSASLRYSIPYSWSFEASFVYAGRRYVTIDPSRRMERVASTASSPEAAKEFSRQERLPDASVVNLYISKRFRFMGREMFASVAVNNLLDRKDILYGGYEQMRVRKEGSGVNLTYSPFPSRYLYSYPRSFYATLILNF